MRWEIYGMISDIDELETELNRENSRIYRMVYEYVDDLIERASVNGEVASVSDMPDMVEMNIEEAENFTSIRGWLDDVKGIIFSIFKQKNIDVRGNGITADITYADSNAFKEGRYEDIRIMVRVKANADDGSSARYGNTYFRGDRAVHASRLSGTDTHLTLMRDK